MAPPRAIALATAGALATACSALIGLDGLTKDCATCDVDAGAPRPFSTPGAHSTPGEDAKPPPPRDGGGRVDPPDVCTPDDAVRFCSRLGRNCGPVSGTDGCGGALSNIDCGRCTAPQTCGGGGGGGTANVCGSAGTTSIFDGTVTSSSDDAEEDSRGHGVGGVKYESPDLELMWEVDVGATLHNGFRITNVTIPKNAKIKTAYVQFTAGESGTRPLGLLILFGEASDNAATFAKVAYSISSRPKTSPVSWPDVPTFNFTDEATANERTPELKTIVQEIVNRPNWVTANSIVIIVTGTKQPASRVVWAYDGDRARAPRLHIEYE